MNQQGGFNEFVTKHSGFLAGICNDEEVPTKTNTTILLRKFWFRLKLFTLYCKNSDATTIVNLGSGTDRLGSGLKSWKLLKIDGKEHEGVMKMDLNEDLDKLEEIIKNERKSNNVVLVMEGLTYYLRKDSVKRILEMVEKHDLKYILDGCCDTIVRLMKSMNLETTCGLPLDFLPKNSKVVKADELKRVFGEDTVNVHVGEIYYVSNF